MTSSGVSISLSFSELIVHIYDLLNSFYDNNSSSAIYLNETISRLNILNWAKKNVETVILFLHTVFTTVGLIILFYGTSSFL